MVIKARSFIGLITAVILMLIGILTASMVGVLALQQGIQTAQFANELAENFKDRKNSRKNRHRFFFIKTGCP